MRIIAKKRLRRYTRVHPDAAAALTLLENQFEKAKWKSMAEVQQTRKDSDSVKADSGRILQVFNVRQNFYRLICHIHFNKQRIYIREFLTHREYDRGSGKGEIENTN